MDLHRPTARLDAQPALDPVQNTFGYNVRSEVQSALMGTNTYGYAYDPIGNRLVATNNAVATAYLANELNQYTNVLRVSAPPREDIPIHDADGNLLSNGQWTFAWDGENRLLSASNATTLVTYVHDFQSRRVGRKQYTWDTDHWSPTTDHRFLYDGWALIREVAEAGTGTATNHFVYGLDLSGSLQGAGTIGGILSMHRSGTDPATLQPFDPATLFYTYDGNGNVSELVGPTGAIRAHYEYSPFGEITTQSGDLAAANPFRFSTKRQDEATGLLYYGHRDLNTVWGRWMNRDPIEERGGVNLYTGASAHLVNSWDLLGLYQLQGGYVPFPGFPGTGGQWPGMPGPGVGSPPTYGPPSWWPKPKPEVRLPAPMPGIETDSGWRLDRKCWCDKMSELGPEYGPPAFGSCALCMSMCGKTCRLSADCWTTCLAINTECSSCAAQAALYALECVKEKCTQCQPRGQKYYESSRREPADSRPYPPGTIVYCVYDLGCGGESRLKIMYNQSCPSQWLTSYTKTEVACP